MYDKKELERALAQYGSKSAAARELGIPRTTFRRKIGGEQWLNKERINIKDAIKSVEDAGYFVTKKPLQRDYRFDLDIEMSDEDTYKVGLVSDTHLCSKYQQLTNLHTFYRYCADQGITTILHAGDISDGMNVYRGQEFEVFQHGADSMLAYIVNNYPEYEITTELLCGNHDESIYKRAGMDIGLAISKQRSDIIYRGFYQVNFLLDGYKIALHHGTGSVAYARSYKPQKLALAHVENYDEKPEMIIIGHYHCSCILPEYLNMYMLQMPSFQAQTPYLKAHALMPDIAGIIIEFKYGVIPKCEYVKYDVIKGDY